MLKNWLLIKKTKCSKSIPGFFISRLANVEDFFNVNIFLKCQYLRINDYSSKYFCVVCCLKVRFYLWNIDLLDTHLDLLETDIPSKYFLYLHNVFKTSSKYISRHLQDMSSRRLQDTSSRRLQDVSSVTIFRLPRRL